MGAPKVFSASFIESLTAICKTAIAAPESKGIYYKFSTKVEALKFRQNIYSCRAYLKYKRNSIHDAIFDVEAKLIEVGNGWQLHIRPQNNAILEKEFYVGATDAPPPKRENEDEEKEVMKLLIYLWREERKRPEEQREARRVKEKAKLAFLSGQRIDIRSLNDEEKSQYFGIYPEDAPPRKQTFMGREINLFEENEEENSSQE